MEQSIAPTPIEGIIRLTPFGLKYDFLISPGAEPDAISIQYDGYDDLVVSTEGNLNIFLPTFAEPIVEDRPYCYQMIHGIPQEPIMCRL